MTASPTRMLLAILRFHARGLVPERIRQPALPAEPVSVTPAVAGRSER